MFGRGTWAILGLAKESLKVLVAPPQAQHQMAGDFFEAPFFAGRGLCLPRCRPYSGENQYVAGKLSGRG
jgi:hypothetical protein